MSPLVRFRNVSKTYDGRHVAVRDLSLDVARGEFLTLLGPSGSGKTTAMMMLAGFEAPSAGTIEMDGQDLASVPPHRRGIGVVFQSYALFPHMDVAANVAFPLAARGVGRAERTQRVQQALRMVRLDAFAGRKPAMLSGGQQQRVALARALVFQPSLVLLDEPLGALDRQLREEMQAELRDLHRRLGVTMICVTHDQQEALALSDRIAVFRDGAVQQVATPEDLYRAPANEFVAGFVGENNRLAGVVQPRDGQRMELAEIRLDCGPLVQAGSSALQAGRRCIVSVRPEDVTVAPDGAAGLPARLIDSMFLGDQIRLRLALGEGGEIVARRPAAEGVAGLAPGSAVTVAWPPARAQLFGGAP